MTDTQAATASTLAPEAPAAPAAPEAPGVVHGLYTEGSPLADGKSPAGPIESKRPVASAAPHWTETIDPITSRAAPRVRASAPAAVTAIGRF